MLKTKDIEIRTLKENVFDHKIREEHYLHRANSTHPSVHYGFYFQDQLVALQEWSAIFKPILLRFPFLKHYEIIDNSRFLLRTEFDLFEKEIKIYNLGSRTLSIGIKNIVCDWQKITNTTPKLLITYIDQKRGLQGTVYRAANWAEIGNSAGKNYNKKRGIDYKPTPKKTFIYRLSNKVEVNPVTTFEKEFLKQNWMLLNEVAQYNYKPRDKHCQITKATQK